MKLAVVTPMWNPIAAAESVGLVEVVRSMIHPRRLNDRSIQGNIRSQMGNIFNQRCLLRAKHSLRGVARRTVETGLALGRQHSDMAPDREVITPSHLCFCSQEGVFFVEGLRGFPIIVPLLGFLRTRMTTM